MSREHQDESAGRLLERDEPDAEEALKPLLLVEEAHESAVGAADVSGEGPPVLARGRRPPEELSAEAPRVANPGSASVGSARNRRRRCRARIRLTMPI